MDIFLGLFTLVITTVLAGVIYFILVPSLKEKSYDEVKAEQKKKAEEYMAQGRSAKEKAKDKKLKKAKKEKGREKTSSDSIELSSDEVDASGTKGHVAFVEPPVIEDEPAAREEIEVKTEVQPVVQKQAGKASKAQAKEAKVEKQSAKQQNQPAAKPADKPVPTAKPADKPVPAAKPDKPAAKPQEKPAEKPVPVPKPVEEVVAKTSTKQSQTVPSLSGSENASPSIRTSRKKRSELATLQQMSGDKEAVNVSLLMPLVHKAELSWTEIQVLIDVLLNKQQGSVDSAEWIEGRQDPVVKLKKQLAEKEKALTEEQEAGAALQSKLKELRNELNAEKHQVRQLGEAVAARQTELAGVGGRLQLAAEEKQSLVQQIQQLQAKLSEEHGLLCKLQEDQGQTQNVLQQELLAQRQQLEMHITRLTDQHQETMAALEAQMTQMASQLQEQEAMNTSLSGELALMRERGAHLQDSALQSQDLSRQITELHSEIDRLMNKSTYDTGRLQTEVNSLTEQLNIKRVENEKLSSLVQNLQTENNRLTHQISSACVEARQLRDENESLAAQVTASMERPATEGRENGDTSYTESKHLDNSVDKVHEKEVLIESLTKEVGHVKTDLAQKEAQISTLRSDLDTAHSNAEKMLKEISSYKCLVQEQESVINALKEEGDSAHKLVNTLREDIAKNKAELTRLSKDCATREQLDSKESTIEKLTSELNTHKTKLADQLAQIQALEKRAGGSSEYKTQLVEREGEVKQLRTELAASKEAVSRLTQQVKEVTDKHSTLVQDLEAQRLRNDDLRTKNWKAMEALSTTEKTLETKMKQSQRLVSEAEDKSRLEEQEKTKQFLQRIFPHISVDNKQRYESWLEEVGKAVVGSENGSASGDASMLAELEKQNCQLQAMVTHYKAIIADTEGMLNRLQSHVEQEETRWTHQLQTLQTQLEHAISEKDRLQGPKNGIRTSDDGSDTN